MNFLFIVGFFDGYCDANFRIAIKLASEIRKIGHRCNLLAYSWVITEIRTESVDGIDFLVMPINQKNAHIKKEYLTSNTSKVSFFLKKPFSVIKYLANQKDDFKLVAQYVDKTFSDSIPVYFVAPSDSTFKIIKASKRDDFVLYQLDPWGLHELIDSKTRIREIKKENSLFEKSKHVFTTSLLYKQYQNNPVYKKYLDKITMMQFPNLSRKRKKRNELFLQDYIYVVHLGTVEDEYRDPKGILNALLNIKEKYRLPIKILFFGKILSKTLDKYSLSYPREIIKCGIISYDESNMIMNSDNIFLLNINNTISNQSPSKLIDYISTGNPIVNVAKRTSDVSIEVLSKYENSITVNEETGIDENALYSFLINNRNKRVLYDAIEEKYVEYTPEYCAERVIEALRKKDGK